MNSGQALRDNRTAAGYFFSHENHRYAAETLLPQDIFRDLLLLLFLRVRAITIAGPAYRPRCRQRVVSHVPTHEEEPHAERGDPEDYYPSHRKFILQSLVVFVNLVPRRGENADAETESERAEEQARLAKTFANRAGSDASKRASGIPDAIPGNASP